MLGLSRNKSLNLETAYKYVKRNLRKYFKHIDFKYQLKEDVLEVEANCTMDELGDFEIYINICDYGLVSFCVVFDEVPATEYNLRLANEYNANAVYFRAYIDDYLHLSHEYKCMNIKDLKTYSGDMIVRFYTESDDETLLKLLGRN